MATGDLAKLQLAVEETERLGERFLEVRAEVRAAPRGGRVAVRAAASCLHHAAADGARAFSACATDGGDGQGQTGDAPGHDRAAKAAGGQGGPGDASAGRHAAGATRGGIGATAER